MKRIYLMTTVMLWCSQAFSAYLTISPRVVSCEDGAGKTYQLKAFLNQTYIVTDVTESEDVVWSTSDSTVATVDSKGLVTIHANGSATIHVTTDKYNLQDFGVNNRDNCLVTSLPVGGTAAPLLREDLVWVGNCQLGPYHIQVAGDTIAGGISYKKVYRRLNDINAYPEMSDLPRIISATLSESTPVACLREDNGRVYRLCDKGPDGFYRSDWDDPDNNAYGNLYTHLLNATDIRYEVVMYDFNLPNVYNWDTSHYGLQAGESIMIAGENLRVYKNDDVQPPGVDCSEDDWWNYYDDHKWTLLMVEGFGMLNGGWQGRDWLCPVRTVYRSNHGISELGIFYVRDSKGNVLLYDDYWLNSDEEGGLAFCGSDPYDFSGDGEFDIADVNAVINIMIGLRENDPEISADLSFDQMVDIEDLNLIINRMLSDVEPVKYSDLLKPSSEY